MGQEELRGDSETPLEVELHLGSGIIPNDPVALSDTPQPVKPQKRPEVVTVCLGREPHLNVLVNLKLDGGDYLQVVEPYDTGSHVSFINESY